MLADAILFHFSLQLCTHLQYGRKYRQGDNHAPKTDEDVLRIAFHGDHADVQFFRLLHIPGPLTFRVFPG